jgi:hypothetical protein
MEGRIEFALAVWRKAQPYMLSACGGAVIGFLLGALVWA